MSVEVKPSDLLEERRLGEEALAYGHLNIRMRRRPSLSSFG